MNLSLMVSEVKSPYAR